jgi:hypothetical protein
MMAIMNKFIAGLLALVIAFAVGFMPQYVQKRRLQSELTVCSENVGMSELRDLAGMMLIEVLRLNYGTARDYSTQYFTKLMERSDSVEDAASKASMQELLSKRDAITTSLAKADPASATEVQTLFVQTRELKLSR